jgi:hypothetical protein
VDQPAASAGVTASGAAAIAVSSAGGARTGGLDPGLDLSGGLLDRRGVRRAGGQEDQLAAGGVHQLGHPLGLVRADVVDHHRLPRRSAGVRTRSR